MLTGHRLYTNLILLYVNHALLLNECTENRNYIREVRRYVWQDELDIIEDLRLIDSIKKHIN